MMRIKASILVNHTAETACDMRNSDRMSRAAPAVASHRVLSTSHHIKASASSRDRNDLVACCRSAGRCATFSKFAEVIMPSSRNLQGAMLRCTQESRDGRLTVSRESAPKSTNLDSGFTCNRTGSTQRLQADFRALQFTLYQSPHPSLCHSFHLRVLGLRLARCGRGLVVNIRKGRRT